MGLVFCPYCGVKHEAAFKSVIRREGKPFRQYLCEKLGKIFDVSFDRTREDVWK